MGFNSGFKGLNYISVSGLQISFSLRFVIVLHTSRPPSTTSEREE